MMGFLQGISPIWWFVAALAIGAVEMLSMTTLLLWPALAAAAVGGLLLLAPELSGQFQVAMFAIFGIALTIIGRWMTSRFGHSRAGGSGLNEPATRAVGQLAEVIEFSGGRGKVMVNGVRWHARTVDADLSFAPGSSVRVRDASGSTLIIDRRDAN